MIELVQTVGVTMDRGHKVKKELPQQRIIIDGRHVGYVDMRLNAGICFITPHLTREEIADICDVVDARDTAQREHGDWSRRKMAMPGKSLSRSNYVRNVDQNGISSGQQTPLQDGVPAGDRDDADTQSDRVRTKQAGK